MSSYTISYIIDLRDFQYTVVGSNCVAVMCINFNFKLSVVGGVMWHNGEVSSSSPSNPII